MDPSDSKRCLTIFHTNDFHNRLTEEKEKVIERRYVSLNGPKLLLDAGDAGGAGNVTFHVGGEPILERMSGIGYSAMTVGNRDFHVTRTGFHCKLYRAAFPILCANIRPSKPGKEREPDRDDLPLASSGSDDEPELYSYIVRQPAPEWKVLLIGLTVPMVTERMWERKLSAYIFDDPIRTASRLTPELQRYVKPDLTVLLTHVGLRCDRELAETVPGIDLIIGGHSHDLLPVGERVGDTLIVQAGSHARHLGIVEVCRPRGDDHAFSMHAYLEAL